MENNSKMVRKKYTNRMVTNKHATFCGLGLTIQSNLYIKTTQGKL